MGVSEMRWTGSGKVVVGDYTYIYSGGSKHQYGVGMVIDKETSRSIVGYLAVSDRVLLVKLQGKTVNLSLIQVYAPTNDASDMEDEKFIYTDLDKARKLCKNNQINVVMGDLNSKVGEGREGKVVVHMH